MKERFFRILSYYRYKYLQLRRASKIPREWFSFFSRGKYLDSSTLGFLARIVS